ncbi:MAG: hypothetical protein AAF531_18000 [Actinomycetota bacterium]
MSMRGLMIALAALLAAAACGTDGEDDLRAATTVAFAERLSFVDKPTARCLSNAYLDELGADGFAEQGLDVETIRGDETSVDVLLDADRDVAVRCLDLGSRLEQLIGATDGELTAECVNPAGLTDDPVVGFLLEPDASLDSIPDEVTDPLLTLTAGCIDDTTYATFAGLPAPAAYLDVLVADPFARPDDPYDQDDCVVGVVFDTVGLQRLDELGVTIEEPNVLDHGRDLTDDELTALTTALDACDLEEQIRRAVAVDEEQIAACLVAQLDQEAYEQIVGNLFLTYRPTIRPPVRPLVEDCVTENLPAGLTDQPQKSEDEERFVDEFVFEALRTSSVYERRCLTGGIRRWISPAVIEAADQVFEEENGGDLATDDQLETFWAFMEQAANSLAECVRPWYLLQADLEVAEIDEAAWPCIRAELGPEQLTELAWLYGPAVWSDDYDAWYDLELRYEVVGDAVEICGSAADSRGWQGLMDFLFYGEGELLDEPAPEVDSA